ncbi:MAG: type IX secretion system sortase PorU [Bacteroidia bacterium]
MSVKKIISFLFLTVFFIAANAQNRNSSQRQLKWLTPVEISITETEKVTVLNCENAPADPSLSFLPVYSEVMVSDFDASVIEIKAELSNEIYEPLKEANLITQPLLIKNAIEANASISHERKKPFIVFSFIPIRKIAGTNSYEKLVSFNIKFIPVKTTFVQNIAPRYYKPNSVLETGTWYKIGVSGNGVYKIDFNFLKNSGIEMSSLNPQQIKIFGNGGGMLPEANAPPRADDLIENAIEVVGESDGVFNDGDYILFYGQSADETKYDAASQRFHTTKHLYCDSAYYFLTTDLGGPSKRISLQSSVSPGINDIPVTTFDDYGFHEDNSKNFTKSGRNFYGEAFEASLTQTFSFYFANLVTTAPVYYKMKVMAHSFIDSHFALKYSGQQLCNVKVDYVCTNYICPYGNEDFCEGTFLAGNSNVNFDIIYDKPQNTSVGYLDNFEVNVRRQLSLSGNQMGFRDKNTVGLGYTAFYTLSNYNSSLTVWDLTDKFNIKNQLVNTDGTFRTTSDVLHEFIVFRNTDFLTPRNHGRIENQNLHSLPQTDLIIVSHPLFMSEANRLADHHRTVDNLRVVVADINQVYNEYSSGMRDVTAIRDFAKMFYDRSATDMPDYLLLFGDGSYLNKADYSGNSNFLPTYQSENSLSLTDSYVSDDFFGLLDSLEGYWPPGSNQLIDLGMGRFPVRSTGEAKNMVDKIIRYSTPGSTGDATSCNPSNSSLGDWRNVICLIADDQDQSIHLDQTENLLVNIDPMINKYNIDKIYLDAYEQESTPGGQRYPGVNDAIDKRMEKGALLVNFTGHGGETGWAHEGILTVAMINAWKNSYRMPLFITATCEFSRFDDPQRVSAGEYSILNPTGGAIALYSTTRLVYSGPNATLNKELINYAFEELNGEMPRLGDIFRLTKRNANVNVGINHRNFTLLGDPALRLSYPKYDIIATALNNQSLAGSSDTIHALSKVTISGEVQSNGQKLTTFNGIVYPTVFDKTVSEKTLSNDGDSPERIFKLQKNVLYKGKASVKNGAFTFTFIVPKDIAYNYGTARFSFYAQNGVEDAAGNYDSLVIGGIDTTTVSDNIGPEIKLFMNDEKFVFGGITDASPKIYALVADDNGINTVGNGIGHDIIATLNNDIANSQVLNDFYESDIDNYQKGKIIYSLNDLTEGRHSLKLKVWDIYNNSSEAITEFIVASSEEIALAHVLNYPNPFTTHTSFFFEHNQPCTDLDVQVQVYTVSGKLVKTLQKHIICDGYFSDSVEWNGLDDFGDRLARGVYVYRLRVQASGGRYAEKYEKLVMLR